MKTLNVYTVAERTPKHGETIFLFDVQHEFGMAYYDPKFVKVEYTWIEIDETGEETGNQMWYEPGVETPSGCRLAMCAGHYELDPHQQYIVSDDIQNLDEP